VTPTSSPFRELSAGQNTKLESLPLASTYSLSRNNKFISAISRVPSLRNLEKKKEDFRIDSEVRSEGAYPLYGGLSRRGSDPIKLPYNRSRMDGQLILTSIAFNRLQPICHQSWSTQNSPFLPQNWPKPPPILIVSTRGKMTRLSGPEWPGQNSGMLDPPKITNPSANRARRIASLCCNIDNTA